MADESQPSAQALVIDVCGSNTTGGGGGTFWVEPKRPTRRAWQAEALRFRTSSNAPIRLEGVGDCTLSAAKLNAPHRPDVELRIIEQRQMHLPAHGGNVGLVEDQSASTAELRVFLREGKHVIACIRPKGLPDLWKRKSEKDKTGGQSSRDPNEFINDPEHRKLVQRLIRAIGSVWVPARNVERTLSLYSKLLFCLNHSTEHPYTLVGSATALRIGGRCMLFCCQHQSRATNPVMLSSAAIKREQFLSQVPRSCREPKLLQIQAKSTWTSAR